MQCSRNKDVLMYGIQKSVTTNQDDFILQLFGLWNCFLNKKILLSVLHFVWKVKPLKNVHEQNALMQAWTPHVYVKPAESCYTQHDYIGIQWAFSCEFQNILVCGLSKDFVLMATCIQAGMDSTSWCKSSCYPSMVWRWFKKPFVIEFQYIVIFVLFSFCFNNSMHSRWQGLHKFV